MVFLGVFFMLHNFLCFVFRLSQLQTTDLQMRRFETCNYYLYCSGICSNNEMVKKTKWVCWRERDSTVKHGWVRERGEKDVKLSIKLWALNYIDYVHYCLKPDTGHLTSGAAGDTISRVELQQVSSNWCSLPLHHSETVSLVWTGLYNFVLSSKQKLLK